MRLKKCLCLVLFAALGLSGIIPAVHTMVQQGFLRSVTVGQLGWLILMAILYLLGEYKQQNVIAIL